MAIAEAKWEQCGDSGVGGWGGFCAAVTFVVLGTISLRIIQTFFRRVPGNHFRRYFLKKKNIHPRKRILSWIMNHSWSIATVRWRFCEPLPGWYPCIHRDLNIVLYKQCFMCKVMVCDITRLDGFIYLFIFC